MNEKKFQFNPENLVLANKAMAKYPNGKQQSAILTLLDLAMRQMATENSQTKSQTGGGYITAAAVTTIAELLRMPEIRVWEVASFFSMVNLKPIGKFHIQVCGTTPCMLRGSETILDTIKKHLGIEKNETTPNQLFTLSEVECLGACCNAPMMQINDDYYEDLDVSSTLKILDDLANGQQPPTGSQIGRKRSEPVGMIQPMMQNK